MKTILSTLLCCITFLLAAQPGGYSRDGAEKTAKAMKILFKESILFSKGKLNIPGDKGENKPAILQLLEESNGVIKEFETKVDEFIQSKPTASVLKGDYNTVTKMAGGLSVAIEMADRGLLEYRSLSAVSFLQDLYLYRAYIAGAMKVYPEAISLEEKLQEADAAIAKHGSYEAYMARMEKNQLDYVKSIRMKKAVMSDAGIEKLVKNEYEKLWAADKVTVTKVNITTAWEIEKNVLDIPLHKEAGVNIAIKKADGTCAIATAYVRQVYEGGGKYGGPYMNMPGPPIVIPCENLK